MGTRYVYSITNATLNGAVNTTGLTNEIKASDITIALDYMNTDADDCEIWFKTELSTSEQTTLGEILSAHTAADVNTDPPTMDDGRPLVRSDTRPLDTANIALLNQLFLSVVMIISAGSKYIMVCLLLLLLFYVYTFQMKQTLYSLYHLLVLKQSLLLSILWAIRSPWPLQHSIHHP